MPCIPHAHAKSSHERKRPYDIWAIRYPEYLDTVYHFYETENLL